MSNSLDPDQARHFVGTDLGPNCLQSLSADDTSRQRFKFQTLLLLNFVLADPILIVLRIAEQNYCILAILSAIYTIAIKLSIFHLITPLRF